MTEYGRKILYTDEVDITEDNILAILQNVMPIHQINAQRCDFLIGYEEGNQPLQRTKTYRADINIECQDNVAAEVTDFKLGFVWGNPITMVQRGYNDYGKRNVTEPEAIALLNEQYETNSIKAKTQQIGRFTEITGIGYEYIDINTNYQDGDSYFNITPLDPRYAFVVRSSYYIDRRIMMGVTYRTDEMGLNHYTCVTPELIFTITDSKIEDVVINPFNMINIIEWERSADRMGCFERQLSEMDNLNIIISDMTNDVDQNTQAIWLGVDIDIATDSDGEEVTPQSGDWLLTHSSEGGKPSLNPLTVPYDYVGMLQNVVTRRSLILQKCNVPQRNDNSGGSTGIAMSDATGWSSAEMSACKQQPLQECAKMQEVRVVLAVIQSNPYVPEDSPLLKLKARDMQPNIKRQKTYEMTVKTNSICALLSKGFSLRDALSVAPLFDDPNQVVLDSGEGVRKYQEAFVFKQESTAQTEEAEEKRPFPDYSDQENNSPMIGKV